LILTCKTGQFALITVKIHVIDAICLDNCMRSCVDTISEGLIFQARGMTTTTLQDMVQRSKKKLLDRVMGSKSRALTLGTLKNSVFSDFQPNSLTILKDVTI
jgi:hypothetical protein